jgi:hypothetical protein
VVGFTLVAQMEPTKPLRLKELCDIIRKNDPSITEVELPVCNRSRLGSLLKALRGNTTVTSLILNVSAHTVHVKFNFTALCQYLENCKFIQAVELRHDDNGALDPEVVSRFVQSLADNASAELVKFESHARLLCSAMVALLQAKSHCLKHLNVHRVCVISAIPMEVDSSERQIAQVVGSLPFLQSLHVAFSSREPTEWMLRQLCSHKHLRVLSLDGFGDERDVAIADALSSVVHSGVPLESLTLNDFAFSTGIVNSLFTGLGACPTLTKLTVESCDCGIDPTVDSALAKGLQNVKNIRELRLTDCGARARSSVNIVTSLLSAERSPSSLQVLDLECHFVDDIQGLLTPLTKEGSQLRSMALGGLITATWLQLTRYLPDFLQLRKLTLRLWSAPGYKYDNRAFLQALEKNGSLHEVLVALDYNGPVFGADDWRWIQSLCDRNRAIPTFLQGIKSRDSGATLNDTGTPLCFVPMLFKVSAQASRMAPTTIMAGLVVASDSIGSIETAKRLCTR